MAQEGDCSFGSLAAATKAAKEYALRRYPSSEAMIDRTFKQENAKRLVCRHRARLCTWSMEILPQCDGSWKYNLVEPNHSPTCTLLRQKKNSEVALAPTRPPIIPINPMPSLAFQQKKVPPPPCLPIIQHCDASGGRPTFALTHDMRWFTAKDASRSVNDYAFFVQKKRARMDKKTSGGRNKKYVCSCESCDWFVRLLKAPKTESWKISSMNLIHSAQCTGVARPSARQLAEMASFRQAVVSHGKQHGKLLTDEFLSSTEEGIKIPLRLAYRAKQMIVVHSKDDVVESYKFLPSFSTTFVTKNPGSITDYERDDENHFIRAFVMPQASIQAMPALQRVMGIDVVKFNKPEYSGSMLLLLGRDGNLQSHVIALALVPTINLDHASWFIQHIHQGISLQQIPIFVPLQYHGIADALLATGSGANIHYCMQSIFEAMGQDKHITKLGAAELLIWDLHRQETEQTFQNILMQLDAMNPPVALFLRTINPAQWAVHANRHVKLYQWSTTSFSSELHGPTPENCDEAPFDLIYSFVARMMDNVYQKSQAAAKLTAEAAVLTPGAQEQYANEMQEALAYTTRPCDENLAFVWKTGSRPKVTYRVNLTELACSCGALFQLGIPCRHFIAAARHFGREGLIINAFDPIYKATTYTMVFHKMRIEIPVENDLTKDETLLPVVSDVKQKSTKKPRAPKAKVKAPEPMPSLEVHEEEMMSAMAMGTLGLPSTTLPHPHNTSGNVDQQTYHHEPHQPLHNHTSQHSDYIPMHPLGSTQLI
ncbi:hypothetical protein THRCLA_20185 [Thraustotheca clavata]|uniref:SWIM-type domain-containing protein n=1 Tax=Thraustotheca clavata TaxID=74557 RepID=A0A1W0AAD8_9STRA|nr:hypothetical protein THRCLA_20185 [Thraustotheca clavata]